MTCFRSLRLVAVLLAAAGARAENNDSYRVKAAFLYNFAKFVEWPEASFKASTDSLSICIAGENPFGDSLERAVENKTAGPHPFTIRVITEIQQAAACQMVFVPDSQRKRFAPADLARGSGLLAVGESPGFATQGGVVNFKIEGGHVRFQINLDAAERQKLIISSKLLNLAEVLRK